MFLPFGEKEFLDDREIAPLDQLLSQFSEKVDMTDGEDSPSMWKRISRTITPPFYLIHSSILDGQKKLNSVPPFSLSVESFLTPRDSSVHTAVTFKKPILWLNNYLLLSTSGAIDSMESINRKKILKNLPNITFDTSIKLPWFITAPLKQEQHHGLLPYDLTVSNRWDTRPTPDTNNELSLKAEISRGNPITWDVVGDAGTAGRLVTSGDKIEFLPSLKNIGCSIMRYRKEGGSHHHRVNVEGELQTRILGSASRINLLTAYDSGHRVPYIGRFLADMTRSTVMHKALKLESQVVLGLTSPNSNDLYHLRVGRGMHGVLDMPGMDIRHTTMFAKCVAGLRLGYVGSHVHYCLTNDASTTCRDMAVSCDVKVGLSDHINCHLGIGAPIKDRHVVFRDYLLGIGFQTT
eukprot:GHVH01015810.1.p1 GENE.GHVH01015810.1~~GHVH01015810.1.p1  ORF type:complete len:406 (+),score=36.72 GHVH01015810.1:1742-2959(+)